MIPLTSGIGSDPRIARPSRPGRTYRSDCRVGAPAGAKVRVDQTAQLARTASEPRNWVAGACPLSRFGLPLLDASEMGHSDEEKSSCGPHPGHREQKRKGRSEGKGLLARLEYVGDNADRLIECGMHQHR
jgi:hypothetical protein